MDMIAAYTDVGSDRAAAALCGCDPKTVKRAVERAQRTEPPARANRARNRGCPEFRGTSVTVGGRFRPRSDRSWGV